MKVALLVVRLVARPRGLLYFMAPYINEIAISTLIFYLLAIPYFTLYFARS